MSSPPDSSENLQLSFSNSHENLSFSQSSEDLSLSNPNADLSLSNPNEDPLSFSHHIASMSFGFGVGDILTLAQFAMKTRRNFADAPQQFTTLSKSFSNLTELLFDTEATSNKLSEAQQERLQEGLESCYSVVRAVDAALQKYSHVVPAKDKKTLRRVWQRVNFDPNEIQYLGSKVQAEIHFLNTLRSGHFVDAKVSRLVDNSQDEKRKTVLGWLSPIDYLPQQADLVLRRQPDSRRWLFASKKYASWLANKGSILFCPGMPGAGKTVTTAVVAEDLERRFEGRPEVLTCYVYCSYQTRDLSISQLLCSLLRSVLQRAKQVPEKVMRAHADLTTRQATTLNLSQRQAQEFLREALAKYSRVTILVDALDELSVGMRTQFTTELLRLRQDCGVSLFVTSRDIPTILQPFVKQGAATLEIRASDEDIRSYLNERIERCDLPEFVCRKPDLIRNIIEEITKASDGMFLLAQLHFESLKGKPRPKIIQHALENLASSSSTYDAAYNAAMSRIEAQGADRAAVAKQALVIVSCARRALTTKELTSALGFIPEDDILDEESVMDLGYIMEVCVGLLAVELESDCVRLVHRSTHEYFERNRKRLFPHAERDMAALCHRYMDLVAATRSRSARGGPFPFEKYVKVNWMFHDLMEEKCGGSARSRPNLSSLAKGLAEYEPTLLNACREGHYTVVDLWLSQTKYDLNRPGRQAGDEDNVLLTIAASRADMDMMKLIFQYGADPNIKNPKGKTALYIAAESGFEDVVALLLARPGIDLEMKGPHGTAFQVATATGNLECARLLEPHAGRGAARAPEPSRSRVSEKPAASMRGGREAETRPVQSEYRVDMRPARGGNNEEVRPAQSEHRVEMRPGRSEHRVEMRPGQSQHRVETRPVQSEHRVEMRPGQSQHRVEMRPGRGERPVEAKPARGQHEPAYNMRPTQDRPVESGTKTKGISRFFGRG